MDSSHHPRVGYGVNTNLEAFDWLVNLWQTKPFVRHFYQISVNYWEMGFPHPNLSLLGCTFLDMFRNLPVRNSQSFRPICDYLAESCINWTLKLKVLLRRAVLSLINCSKHLLIKLKIFINYLFFIIPQFWFCFPQLSSENQGV